VVGQQNADIANTLQIRGLAWQPFCWLSVYGVYIGAIWRIWLNCPCAASMLPCIKLFWPLVVGCHYADLVFSLWIFLFVCFSGTFLC